MRRNCWLILGTIYSCDFLDHIKLMATRDNGLFFGKIPIFEGLGLFCIGNMDGSPQVSQSYDWC